MDRETEEFLSQTKTAPPPVVAFSLTSHGRPVPALEVWTGEVLHVQFACRGCSHVLDVEGSKQLVAVDRETGKMTIQGRVTCPACGLDAEVRNGDLL